MMYVTAVAIKELRNRSGAGMMDCKKALSVTNGNIEAAIDWLRRKNLAFALTKSTRFTSEGVIAIKTDVKQGAMIELNSETDFVSRNKQFQNLALEVAHLALIHQGNFDNIYCAKMSNGDTLKHNIIKNVGQIGENIIFKRVTFISVDNGIVASYIHTPLGKDLGRIGVLIGLQWQGMSGSVTKLADLGKYIAMHIAAAKPDYVHQDEIPQNIIEREQNILTEQVLSSGKPRSIVAKIVEGRMKKFFGEVCLLDQIFVMDNKIRIKDLLKQKIQELGGNFVITSFSRFMLGESDNKIEFKK